MRFILLCIASLSRFDRPGVRDPDPFYPIVLQATRMLTLPVLRPRQRRSSSLPSHLVYANSTADVQAEVLRCADDGERLRPTGGTQQVTPLTACDDNRLSLSHMRGADLVQIERRRLWVRAGTPLADVADWLMRHELMLGVRAEYPGQTVGGAVSTGTPGDLVQRIVSLRMVLADGRVEVYSTERNAHLMDAMRVSLGALGIITHVELRCETWDNRVLRRREVEADELDELLARPRIETGLQTVTWFACAPAVVECRLLPDGTSPPSLLDQARAACMEGFGSLALVRYAPHLPGGKRFSDRLGSRYARSPIRDVLPPRMTHAARKITYALPSAAAAEVLRSIRDLWNGLRFRSYAPLQLDFSPPDRAWLAPSQACDTVLISFPYVRSTPKSFIEALCLLLERNDGRPAWNGLPPDYIPTAAHYPRLQEFAELRAEMDPHGVFLNPFLERLCGLPTR